MQCPSVKRIQRVPAVHLLCSLAGFEPTVLLVNEVLGGLLVLRLDRLRTMDTIVSAAKRYTFHCTSASAAFRSVCPDCMYHPYGKTTLPTHHRLPRCCPQACFFFLSDSACSLCVVSATFGMDWCFCDAARGCRDVQQALASGASLCGARRRKSHPADS